MEAKTVTVRVTGDPCHYCHGASRGAQPCVSRGAEVLHSPVHPYPVSHSPPSGRSQLCGLLWVGPQLCSSSRKIFLFCVFSCFSWMQPGILRGIPGDREGSPEAAPC